MQYTEGSRKNRSRQGEPWSAKELADLKNLYPVRTNQALARHFGRSEMSITTKANHLHLTKQLTTTRRKNRPWSDLEVGLLKQLYPDTSLEEIAAELVGRSILAVQEKALLLGLRRLRPWTAEEISLLRKLWPNTEYSDIATRLNRSIQGIKAKGYKLGLPRRKANSPTPGHSGHKKRTRPPVHPWSTDEIKCLKHLYPSTPIKEIARHLENRTEAAIISKACSLGLRQPCFFTEQEDRYICILWPDMNAVEIARKLGRSPQGIRVRAEKLGLEPKSNRPWTKQDDALLQKLFYNPDYAELAEIIGRTPAALKQRAHVLGLLSTPNHWTDREEAFLRKHWQDKPGTRIARELKRSANAVRAHARALGLKRFSRKLWTDQEIQILKEMHGQYTAADIAKRLGRTPGTVHSRLSQLGLTTPPCPPWSPQEKQRLKALYGQYTKAEIAEKLGRSIGAVDVKITELGLARSK